MIRWRSRHLPHPSAPLKMSAELAGTFRFAARAVGAISLVAFGFLAVSRGVPCSLENDAWEEVAQSGLLAVLAVGYLAAWKWAGLGASILIVGGVALGVVASVAHPPLVALFAALAFVVPGLGFAIHWQWHAGSWRLAVLAVMVTGVLMAGGWASVRVYDSYYGPTHPSSSTRLPKTDLVEWAWSGAEHDQPKGFYKKKGKKKSKKKRKNKKYNYPRETTHLGGSFLLRLVAIDSLAKFAILYC